MSKSELHRWALLDKAGKTRGTCIATYWSDAVHAFKLRRHNAGTKRWVIPIGWTIVDRGPVDDDQLVLAADPAIEVGGQSSQRVSPPSGVLEPKIEDRKQLDLAYTTIEMQKAELDALRARAETAEAKLADIRAIRRTEELSKGIPGESTFQAIVDKVLAT